MSDSRSSYGDPVDEPTDAPRDADVVGRAHEGLAEAEAARREVPEEAVADDPREPDAPETVVVEETVVEERVVDDSDDDARWAAYAASADVPEEASTAAGAPVAATPVAAAPAVTPSEPVAEPAPVAYPGPQPIFVQAPEPPRARGNRGAAGAIGLLAALAFAVLYLAATVGFGLLYGEFDASETLDATLAILTTWGFWVPVVVFFLGFWLLGAVINRGRWGHWVVWGILVGVAAYLGHLLGALFEAPFWQLTAREGSALLEAEVLTPLAIVAFVLGRELTIWFGSWVAARGRRVTELNDEAQREYERTLEAGPQLHRA